MKRFLLLILCATILLTVIPGIAAEPQPADYPWNGQWTLKWADEFNAPDGEPADKTKWVHDIGGGGWGNNELEFYTFGKANAYHEKGNLVIVAKDEERAGYPYTSARLKTRGKFEQMYGRFEARMKLPYGQGIWPAFWMLGANYSQVSWPHCGEIDIMENIGREPSTVHATVHGPGYSGGNGISKPYFLSDGKRFADDFHTFAIEWEPNVIRWYVDDKQYAELTPEKIPANTRWVFNEPFFILINLAVGGGWPGYPDDTTKFPQYFTIDYIRVFERK